MIRAIIFDWGRTLYDKEHEQLFPETKEILDYCIAKYKLCIVSLAIDEDIEGRFTKLDQYNLRKYFQFALYHISDKNSLFRNALGNLHLKPEEVMVVDDRIKRLQYCIKHGFKTVWLKQGKFAHEEPNEETGYPTYTITSLKELLTLV